MKRDHAQKFPWNQFFSNFFSKNVDLTEKLLKFFVKTVIVFLTNFYTTGWGIGRIDFTIFSFSERKLFVFPHWSHESMHKLSMQLKILNSWYSGVNLAPKSSKLISRKIQEAEKFFNFTLCG